MNPPLLLGIAIVCIITAGIGLWIFGERGKLLRNSTREWFTNKHWKPKGKVLNAIHGYLYMRWQNQYIKYFIIQMGKIAPQSMRRLITDRYHAKVLPHEQAKAIIKVNQSISRKDLDQIVPYPIARDFLIKAPPEIIVYECGCRNARKTHCEPTQVCMWIGQPYIDFILEHNPKTAKQITKEEALQLLEEEHDRGHVHTAWFKDAMQERFYCICNCCSCCCAGIESMRKYGVQSMSSSGFLASINTKYCTMCETCAGLCPFQAITIHPDQMTVNAEKCMGCGVCVDQCPNNAIKLIRAPAKGIPFDMRVFSDAKGL